MRNGLVALCATALFSCRSGSTVPAPDAAAASSAQQSVDEGTVKTMSHALLDSWDRASEDGFTRMIGATFEQLDVRDLNSRSDLLDRLRARRERQAPPCSRTYGEEHVSIGDNSAVFVGEAVEHFLPDDTQPTGDFDGWNTEVCSKTASPWCETRSSWA